MMYVGSVLEKFLTIFSPEGYSVFTPPSLLANSRMDILFAN